MATVAICACGVRFIVKSTKFPRPITCHACGSRAILTSPTEFRAGDGWRVGEEEEAAQTDGPVIPPGMVRCHACGKASSSACARCGRFYCWLHGRARLQGNSTCTTCYDEQRPFMAMLAVVFAVLGLAFLLLPLFVTPPQGLTSPYWFLIPTAGVFFTGAVLYLWFAVRKFP
jgi:hypothetical protein